MTTEQWVWQTKQSAWAMRSRVAQSLEYNEPDMTFEVDGGGVTVTVLATTVTPGALDVQVREVDSGREYTLVIPYDNDPAARASLIVVPKVWEITAAEIGALQSR